MKQYKVCIFLLFFFYLTTNSQTNKSKVDSLLSKYVPSGFNGSILISSRDTIVFKGNYGIRNFLTSEPINDSTLFELASCTKQFTAMAILKLMEQGKLSLNDSLRHFFPELPYSKITLTHMLNHTSGLKEYMKLIMDNCNHPYCFNEDIIRLFSEKKPKLNFEPGSQFQYSNTNYAILASIIEKVSGVSYSEYLNENLFKPLNMNRTRVYNTRRTKMERIPNYAIGYVYSKKKKQFMIPDSLKEYNYVLKLDGIVGDGCVNTTVSDLYKWDQGLYGNKVLSQETIQLAYKKAKTNNGKSVGYGFGYMVYSDKEVGKVMIHGGSWPGYESMMFRFINKDKLIVILCNKVHPKDNITELMNQLSLVFVYR